MIVICSLFILTGFNSSIYATISFRIFATILAKVHQVWVDSVGQILQVATITSSLTLQSIPAPPSNPSRANSLGFDSFATPQKDVVMALITNFWGDPGVGQQVQDGTAAFINNVTNIVEDEGVAQKFIYENYAAAGFQDPLESTAHLDQFRKVAAKYDPNQVFQRQVVGGWKLY